MRLYSFLLVAATVLRQIAAWLREWSGVEWREGRLRRSHGPRAICWLTGHWSQRYWPPAWEMDTQPSLLARSRTTCAAFIVGLLPTRSPGSLEKLREVPYGFFFFRGVVFWDAVLVRSWALMHDSGSRSKISPSFSGLDAACQNHQCLNRRVMQRGERIKKNPLFSQPSSHPLIIDIRE